MGLKGGGVEGVGKKRNEEKQTRFNVPQLAHVVCRAGEQFV